jgi:hypothetical protein
VEARGMLHATRDHVRAQVRVGQDAVQGMCQFFDLAGVV